MAIRTVLRTGGRKREPATAALLLKTFGCRFRKLHPFDSRSQANQNMIAA